MCNNATNGFIKDDDKEYTIYGLAPTPTRKALVYVVEWFLPRGCVHGTDTKETRFSMAERSYILAENREGAGIYADGDHQLLAIYSRSLWCLN